VEILPLLQLAPFAPKEFRRRLDIFRQHYSVPNSLHQLTGNPRLL
jgi:hypothetical protein